MAPELTSTVLVEIATGLMVNACTEFKQTGNTGLITGAPGTVLTVTFTCAHVAGVTQPPSART